MAIPFYGDGMRVLGMIELIGKRENNPIFTLEDEFLMQSFASLATIIFSQITIKKSAEKNTDNIATFLAQANSNLDGTGFLILLRTHINDS
jgi:hypothetical protein